MPPYCLTALQAISTDWIHQDPQNCFLSHSGAFWATFGHFWALGNQFWRHPTSAMGPNRSGWMPPYCFNCFPGNSNRLDPSEPTKLLFEPFWSNFAQIGPFLGQFWAPRDQFWGCPKFTNWSHKVELVSLGGKGITIVTLALRPLFQCLVQWCFSGAFLHQNS